MIATRIKLDKLIAFQALMQAGTPPEKAQKILGIKRRSYFYYQAELRRLEQEARRLAAAES